ncbi:MAG: class II histone deacetylase [Pseudonocardiaceae bacterium]
MATGYLWHDSFADYDMGVFHPPGAPDVLAHPHIAGPLPVTRMAALVEASGLLAHLSTLEPVPAGRDDLLRVHGAGYLDRLGALSAASGGDTGDGWSPFGPGGFAIARLAAGAAITAVEAVLTGTVGNAYALARPAGHHAGRDAGMGFCMLATIPVAIERARALHGVKRVAVVDYDVHHGNGTEGCYASDPDVLTVSVHQDRLFPADTGFAEHRGTGAGLGAALNIPLPPGCGDGAYTAVLREAVGPAVRRFAPELIVVASGFDASAMDPLGRMAVTAAGYGAIAADLVDLAGEVCGGRLVLVHEGGYSPIYVPYCGLAVLEAMSGHPTGVGDPYAATFAGRPHHAVTPAQRDIIRAAATSARDVPAGLRRR